MNKKLPSPLFKVSPDFRAIRQPSDQYGFTVSIADVKRHTKFAFTGTQAAHLLAALKTKARHGRSMFGDMTVDPIPGLDGATEWRVGLYGETVVFVISTVERDSLISVLTAVIEVKK